MLRFRYSWRINPRIGRLLHSLGLVASPHPAAITVATILQRLIQTFSLGSVVVSIFEPASERGNNAVEELRQQTINIFSFQKSPKDCL